MSAADITVTGAPDSKPEITLPDGPAPAELVITDLVEGDGAEAGPNATVTVHYVCLLYTSPSPRDRTRSRMPSSA